MPFLLHFILFCVNYLPLSDKPS